jgi:hypothetical protein
MKSERPLCEGLKLSGITFFEGHTMIVDAIEELEELVKETRQGIEEELEDGSDREEDLSEILPVLKRLESGFREKGSKQLITDLLTTLQFMEEEFAFDNDDFDDDEDFDDEDFDDEDFDDEDEE